MIVRKKSQLYIASLRVEKNPYFVDSFNNFFECYTSFFSRKIKQLSKIPWTFQKNYTMILYTSSGIFCMFTDVQGFFVCL